MKMVKELLKSAYFSSRVVVKNQSGVGLDFQHTVDCYWQFLTIILLLFCYFWLSGERVTLWLCCWVLSVELSAVLAGPMMELDLLLPLAPVFTWVLQSYCHYHWIINIELCSGTCVNDFKWPTMLSSRLKSIIFVTLRDSRHLHIEPQ